MKQRYNLRRWLAAPMVGALVLAGCTSEDWDWMSSGSTGAQKDSPAARTSNASREQRARPSQQSPPTAASQEDARAREVDERVTRYVESMNTRSDSDYVPYDLNSRIQRQSDPERADRIRQTAARARGDQSSVADDSSHPAPAVREADFSENLEPYAGSSSGDRSTDIPLTARRDDRPPAIDGEDDLGTVVTVFEEPPVSRPTEDVEPVDDTAASGESATDDALKPPVLIDISVATPSEEKTVEQSTPTDRKIAEDASPQRINVNAPPNHAVTVADSFKARIVEQEKLVARDPENMEELFRLRLLYLIDGQDEKALAPTPGLSAAFQEIVHGQIASLMSARGTSERDPALWANRQLEALENLRALVRAQADLRVPRVELCSAIDGFGRYEPIVPPQFTVGGRNQVIVYMEVDNFQTENTASGLYRTLMSVRASLLNKSGEEIWSMRDENIEDLSRQRRSDFFLTIGPLAIPKTLGPGEYVMKVEVEDIVGGKIGSNFAKFKMLP